MCDNCKHCRVRLDSYGTHDQVVGSKVAPLKQSVSGSVEWARLEPAGECTVAQFIDTLPHKKGVKSHFILLI